MNGATSLEHPNQFVIGIICHIILMISLIVLAAGFYNCINCNRGGDAKLVRISVLFLYSLYLDFSYRFDEVIPYIYIYIYVAKNVNRAFTTS